MKTNVIGVFNKEVFIFSGISSIDGHMIMDVIRPVEKDTLESLRTIEGLKNYNYDEFWIEAVQNRETESSLDDWLQEFLDDCYDDEDFPYKDNSYVDEMSKEVRQIVDKFLLDNYNVEVGTWECSGFFRPNEKNFKGFDLVINSELAEKYYKEIGLTK